ncbi:hypothetical protein ACG33_04515 [Steroidobacter denitrificans]|uniref:Uncharacterized protein n=1 Tax=Steroidobacter denitrificans TaxID=465721 RepID=A0A127F9R9_STEDE|nr:EAL domain-containing response regulator [Steroidobacter denitrificans]AMN46381.1 hypothetical protein ACG33_04515 [Steroidobacter denitrificans]
MVSPTSLAHLTSVLIVDDSEVQRNHSASLCSELGIATIHQAGNGREALALLATLSPSLLIVDLEMPTMDGAELLHRLQQQAIDIPVIVVSSHERMLINAVRDMGSVLGLRIVGALQKPLTVNLLHEILHNHAGTGTGTGTGIEPQIRAQPPVDAEMLRSAIENGEIQVHYQPKVDVRTGIMRGVEALARWRHATLGVVPPEQFVRLAECNGLIHALTLHVMNLAMLQINAWRARGLHLSVSINLSPLLLEHSDLAHEISSLQRCYGLSADQIVLEVTESSLVTQLGVALGVLTQLRLRGFGLSIDDYGTGFSSLQQLARIPFTELKIDREFVHGAHERKNLQIILRSALEMANQLGLVTVAEGVETMQDWRLLQEFGCKLGQGWFIAKAMPAAEVLPWLRMYPARRRALERKPTESPSLNRPA